MAGQEEPRGSRDHSLSLVLGKWPSLSFRSTLLVCRSWRERRHVAARFSGWMCSPLAKGLYLLLAGPSQTYMLLYLLKDSVQVKFGKDFAESFSPLSVFVFIHVTG